MIPGDRSARGIFLFWLPLALQWLMMALEGPFLAAVIARLPDPTFNLAAYGVAFAFAILVESPVIMLMSASTALVEDAASYRRLRNFAYGLNVFATMLLLVVLVPPVYDAILRGAIGLPDRVADLVYGSLWLLLPWPAAIGYRRFLHGVLIRSGRTRLVALGTALRLTTMGATALVLSRTMIPGAWVGAAALATGVVVEAAAARLMAADAVRDLAGTKNPAAGTTPLDYPGIVRFYYPLALTSLIGLTVHPLLTFFMGRSPAPVESLALFPVVHSLYFIFSALAMSFQEAAIALLGREGEHLREVRRFGSGLALGVTGALGLIAFTPLAGFWFGTVSGLPPRLVELAVLPTRIFVLLPALGVALAFQRAVLVRRFTTRPITFSTAVEVMGIALLFPLLGWGAELMGVVAAALALLGGRAVGVLYLVPAITRSTAPRPRESSGR